MFQQRLASKLFRLRDSKLAAGCLKLQKIRGAIALFTPIFSMAEWRSASSRRQNNEKKKKKPRVDYEPRSAHGRAVNMSGHAAALVRSHTNCLKPFERTME